MNMKYKQYYWFFCICCNFLIFVYVSEQDLGLEFYVLGESFETSAPWDR